MSKHLKADTVVKNYWRNNEQFADLFNAVLFQGKQVIRPDELEDMDTEESSVLEHRKFSESIQASRDNIKIRKKSSVHDVELAMLGNEGQEYIHYAMPMRVMGYDYGSYKKQYDSNAKKNKKAGSANKDEYLSRMKKADKLIPVITLVVYYGEKPWDGATSLHGMLALGEEMAPYVNDYKLLLVEARQNNFPFHNTENIDFFNLLEIMQNKNKSLEDTKKKAVEYIKEHKIDKSVIMTVAGAAKCEIDYDMLEQKGEMNMWSIFEENMEKGRVEGRAEGRAESIIEYGIEFGLSEEDILERLQSRLSVSLQKAQEYFERFKNPAV